MTTSPGSGHPVSPRPPMRGQRRDTSRKLVLNWRLAAVTLVALLLLVPALDFFHQRQIAAHVSSLLVEADRATAAGNPTAAEDFLRAYLKIKPADIPPRLRLGEVIESEPGASRDPGRAIAVYSAVLDIDPENPKAHERLGELFLRDSPQLALEHISRVLSREPASASALRLRARAKERLAADKPAALPGVVKAYREALAAGPADIDTSVRLATLFWRYAKPLAEQEKVSVEKVQLWADEVVDAMVRGNESGPDAAKARLARHDYHRLVDSHRERPIAPSTARADVAAALAKEPADATALLASARLILFPPEGVATGKPLSPADLNQAIEQLEKARSLAPEDSRIPVLLADAYRRANRREAAADTLAAAIRSAKGDAVDLRLAQADLLLEIEDWTQARAAIDQLEGLARGIRDRHGSQGAIEQFAVTTRLLSAAWYLNDNNPSRNLPKGIALLEEVVRSPQRPPLARADLLLGRCHMAVGQFDLALVAFRKAERQDSSSVVPILAAADASLRAGRWQDAIKDYERVLRHPKPDVSATALDQARVHRLRAQLAEQRARPEAKRDWSGFDESLAEARRLSPTVPDLLFLELEADRTRDPANHRASARKKIESQRAVLGKDARFWILVADDAIRLEDLLAADAALVEAERLLGHPAYSLRARLAVARGQDPQVDRLLTENGTKIPANEKATLEAIGRQYLLRQGNVAAWRKQMEAAAERNPGDLSSRFELAMRAADVGDVAELNRWRQELESLEGPHGSYWRLCAIRQALIKADKGDADALAQAAVSARELTSHRPDWGPAHAIEGEVAEQQGNLEQAINCYRLARATGEARLAIIRQLIGLLILTGRTGEAQGQLDSLPESSLVDAEILPLACQLAFARKDFARAKALTSRAVERFPRSAECQVWRAGAMLADPSDQPWANAEEPLRRATQLEPASPAAWTALVSYYAAISAPDALIQVVSSYQGLDQLLDAVPSNSPAWRTPWLVARCQQLVGDVKQAENFYRLARRHGSASALGAITPAGALVTGNRAKKPDEVWAVLIGDRAPRVARPLGLELAAHPKSGDEWFELMGPDLRMQAAASILRGGPKAREQAIERIHSIKPSERRRGDHWMLARLHYLAGRDEMALKEYQSLAERDPPLIALVEYGESAMAAHRYADAERALAAIERKAPRSVAALDLRLRWLVGQKKEAEALERLRGFLGEPAVGTSRAARYRSAIRWAAPLGPTPEAMRLFRGAAAAPPDRLLLADWLSRFPATQQESAALCIEATRAGADANDVAATAGQILSRSKLGTEQERSLRELLDRALAKPSPASLLIILAAAVDENAGRPDAAIQRIRLALKDRPNDPLLLNNLAWLLAAHAGQASEALAVVHRAFLAGGPTANLLDTKGFILVRLGRTEEGIRSLEGAALTSPNVGAIYVHLAEAYAVAKLSEASAAAIGLATRSDRADLSPFDVKLLDRLGKKSGDAPSL